MSSTFTQLYFHIVFGTYQRKPVMHILWRKSLHEYISGIIRSKGQKPIITNGVEDHVHILVGMKPNIALSDLVRDIKNNSSRWVNEKKLTPNKFQWCRGFGAFTHSHSHLNRVYNYVLNQERHHRNSNYPTEYVRLLRHHEIEYDAKYLDL